MSIQKSQNSDNSGIIANSLFPTSSKDSLKGTMFGPTVHDSEIDGLDVSEAASSLGVGVEDIWRRIRNGQLIARSHLGRVFVYTDSTKYQESLIQFSNDQLPPLPDSELPIFEPFDQSVALAQIFEESEQLENKRISESRQELAVLMNHLSLAKEENREILKFTTEAMSRMSQMSDEMIKMKNEVIEARENQVAELSEQLAQKMNELKHLVKENENLSTVAKFFADK